jgi:acyl-CoA thioester hydrolase
MVKKVVFDLPVYTYQIDFAGHVSNIVYVRWMEIARAKLLEAAGRPVAKLAEEGVVPVLAATHIEYKSPVLLGDRVRAEIWISQLKGATARIEVRFFNSEGALAATGWHRGVFVDRETKKPLRVPPGLRAALEPYCEDTVGGSEQ